MKDNIHVIKGVKMVETSRAIKLPAFFKDINNPVFIAIYVPGRSIKISLYSFSSEITESNFVQDIEESTHCEITSDEFYAAFDECINNILKYKLYFNKQDDTHPGS